MSKYYVKAGTIILEETDKCHYSIDMTRVIPDGETLTDGDFYVYDEDDNNVTSDIILSTSVSTVYVIGYFQYPSDLNTGSYDLYGILTFSNGDVKRLKLMRIRVT